MTEAPQHVVLVARIHGREDARDALRELMRETEQAVAREPGCLSYAFAASVDDPDEHLLVGEWTDAAGFEAHYRTDAWQRYHRAVGDLLARPTDARVHHVADTIEPVASEPGGSD